MVPPNAFARSFESFVTTVSFKFLLTPNAFACSFTSNTVGFSAGGAAAETFSSGAVLDWITVSNGSEVQLSTDSTVAKRLTGGGLPDTLPDELSRGLREGGVLSRISSGASALALAFAFLSCFRRKAAVTAPQAGGLLRVLVLPRAATRQLSLI